MRNKIIYLVIRTIYIYWVFNDNGSHCYYSNGGKCEHAYF